MPGHLTPAVMCGCYPAFTAFGFRLCVAVFVATASKIALSCKIDR
jgi:hypothetical protein